MSQRLPSEILSDSRSLYLDLLKRVLVNTIYQDPNVGPWTAPGYIPENRLEGSDWPRDAHTMVGMKRLNNLQLCASTVVEEKIEGDFIETGVWRGGAGIFMRAVLKAYGVTDRNVWLADSFQGLPPPDPEKYPADKGDEHHVQEFLRVSLETVQENFRRYGLLDEQVHFLKGWFKDTLPSAPVTKISLLRMDGDMYESSMDSIAALYPKLSAGGFIIVDDYKAIPGCREAVNEYRERHKITEPIVEIDWAGVYWRKQ